MTRAKGGFGGWMIGDFVAIRLDGTENSGYSAEAECAALPDFVSHSRVRFGR